MKFSAKHSINNLIQADIVAIFLFKDQKHLRSSFKKIIRDYRIDIQESVLQNDFSGKEGETLLVYSHNVKVPRILLVGAGDPSTFSIEKLRRASATSAKKAASLKASSLTLVLSSLTNHFHESMEDIGVAITEGILLSQYSFNKYITSKKTDRSLRSVVITTTRSSELSQLRAGIDRGSILALATNHARDLSNAPGSEIYPETLAKDAQKSGKKFGFTATVFDQKKIHRLKMGGVINVSKGSDKSPRFIILEQGKKYKKQGTVVLVGKGVTFDTGGISIKPSASMGEMKMDMSGAATVIGVFQAIAQMKLKRHVVGLIPAVENMPSGSAVKPGDVIRHYNGKTSEVDNTDAEGRLILADALSFASIYKPNVVIDLATLTGAVVVSLGHFATGMMGNDQPTMDSLTKSGERTYERVWQLPMFDEYEKLIKSDIADVKNVGGRWAGAITAGFFLKKFIGDYKWVHLDIAGTAILDSDQDYTPKGGSGVGVRLLVDFLRNWKR